MYDYLLHKSGEMTLPYSKMHNLKVLLHALIPYSPGGLLEIETLGSEKLLTGLLNIFRMVIDLDVHNTCFALLSSMCEEDHRYIFPSTWRVAYFVSAIRQNSDMSPVHVVEEAQFALSTFDSLIEQGHPEPWAERMVRNRLNLTYRGITDFTSAAIES